MFCIISQNPRRAGRSACGFVGITYLGSYLTGTFVKDKENAKKRGVGGESQVQKEINH
jgi:hypothetical protein